MYFHRRNNVKQYGITSEIGLFCFVVHYPPRLSVQHADDIQRLALPLSSLPPIIFSPDNVNCNPFRKLDLHACLARRALVHFISLPLLKTPCFPISFSSPPGHRDKMHSHVFFAHPKELFSLLISPPFYVIYGLWEADYFLGGCPGKQADRWGGGKGREAK